MIIFFTELFYIFHILYNYFSTLCIYDSIYSENVFKNITTTPSTVYVLTGFCRLRVCKITLGVSKNFGGPKNIGPKSQCTCQLGCSNPWPVMDSSLSLNIIRRVKKCSCIPTYRCESKLSGRSTCM